MRVHNLLIVAGGAAMVAAGIFDTSLQTGVALGLIVVGAGMFMIGAMLPIVSEFEIGPKGFSAKLRDRDGEVQVALGPESERIAHLAAWLAGGPEAGRELAEQAVAGTYANWPKERDEAIQAVIRRLVEAAPEKSPAGEPVEAGVPQILTRLAETPKKQRASLVLPLLAGV